MEFAIQGGGANVPALVDPAAAAAGQAPPANASAFLTGDGGVVVLDTTLTWRITDPAAYYLAQAHVPAALPRLYLASATALAAGGGLDDFLVARPDGRPDGRPNGRTGGPQRGDAGAQAAREAMRGALTDAMNARLAALRDTGASLGIEVTRADIAALLPPSAKIAFDQVLEATQMAEQSVASARTDATRTLQAAQRGRDQTLTEAHAAATERIGQARAQVASIQALAGQMKGWGRADMIDQVYRERLAAIFHQGAAITAVDPAGAGRLILPSGPSGTAGVKP
jgi:modulator of FtsH protease HflK